MNSLLDKEIIQALYRASRAGVHIELIVRGACALRPGVRGVSSRIRVRSVVGRFLEHSRIYTFGNGGQPEMYLGSADWMPRNLYERVEVMFRLKDPDLCRQVATRILAPYLCDTEKSRLLQSDGAYVRAHRNGSAPHSRTSPRFNVQEFLMDLAENGSEPGAPLPSPLPNPGSSQAFEFLSKWGEVHAPSPQ